MKIILLIAMTIFAQAAAARNNVDCSRFAGDTDEIILIKYLTDCTKESRQLLSGSLDEELDRAINHVKTIKRTNLTGTSYDAVLGLAIARLNAIRDAISRFNNIHD